MMYEERKGLMKEEEKVVTSPFPDIEMPEITFTQLIWGRHHPWRNEIAVECGLTGEKYSYSSLLGRAELIGQGLLSEGLRQGDVFACMLINTPDYVAAILGIARAGLTVTSINPLYTPGEIAHHIVTSGAKSILTYPGKLSDVLQAIETLASKDVIKKGAFKVFLSKDPLRSVVLGLEELPEGVKNIEEVVERGRRLGHLEEPALPGLLSRRLAFIANSSGTTGLPKGVALSHTNVVASILQMSHPGTTIFKETTSTHQDVIPMVLPIFHNFGLEIILDALYHGSKIITLPKFEEHTFINVLKNSKASLLFAVPPMVLFIGVRPEVQREHLENLRVIFTAAAPVGEDDINRCLKKAPPHVQFIQGYGQTESMCLLTQVPYGVRNYASIGVPLVNTRMKVIDLQTGVSNPEYKKGEICFKGPQTSLGYVNNPKATREAIDDDGWFHTGDMGYYDSNSYFYIVDRLKEMIKVKGYQVAPAELEAVLRSHPEVEDAGVTSAPDEWKGEVPVGFIRPKPGSSLTREGLREFLSRRVAPFKMIERFIFIEAIPKSASGKILRRELKLLLNNHENI